MSRRSIRIVWPLAMLSIFAVTFRRPPVDRAAVGGAAECAQDPQDTRGPSVADLERCLALDPGDVEAMATLAAEYEAAHRVEEAEALYRRALGIEPHDARVRVALGRLLLTRGDAAGARREGEDALRWHPGNGAATRLVAEARRQ